MIQRRRALTQVQGIIIIVIVAVAGLGVYLLVVKPLTLSPLDQGSFTTITHSTTPLQSTLPPGTTKTQYFMYQNYNRSYNMHISEIYDSKKPAPLVLVFKESKIYQQFISKVDEFGGIAVYPNIIAQDWNPGFLRPENLNEPKVIDDYFILEIVYRLRQQYNIDPDRIYATGYSAGGFMSYELGAEYSDVFAAIAPAEASMGWALNSSAPMQRISEPNGPVSVLILHGTDDQEIHFNGEPRWDGLDPLSVAESAAIWVKSNGCKETPLNTTTTRTFTTVYSGGKMGTEVVIAAYINWGHEYPYDGTDVAWNFFMSHPKQH